MKYFAFYVNITKMHPKEIRLKVKEILYKNWKSAFTLFFCGEKKSHSEVISVTLLVRDKGQEENEYLVKWRCFSLLLKKDCFV